MLTGRRLAEPAVAPRVVGGRARNPTEVDLIARLRHVPPTTTAAQAAARRVIEARLGADAAEVLAALGLDLLDDAADVTPAGCCRSCHTELPYMAATNSGKALYPNRLCAACQRDLRV